MADEKVSPGPVAAWVDLARDHARAAFAVSVLQRAEQDNRRQGRRGVAESCETAWRALDAMVEPDTSAPTIAAQLAEANTRVASLTSELASERFVLKFREDTIAAGAEQLKRMVDDYHSREPVVSLAGFNVIVDRLDVANARLAEAVTLLRRMVDGLDDAGGDIFDEARAFLERIDTEKGGT